MIIIIILIVIMIIFSSSETIQLIILHEILCSRGDLIIPRNNVTCTMLNSSQGRVLSVPFLCTGCIYYCGSQCFDELTRK